MNFPIILMRHAQSQHNVIKRQIKRKYKLKKIKDLAAYHQIKIDSNLRDRPLTQNGILQSQQIQKSINWNQIGLVIVSPSRRCLQTASILLKNNQSIPVIAEPLLLNRISNSWSLGTSKSQLVKNYPGFDLSGLNDEYLPWYFSVLPSEKKNKISIQQDGIEILQNGIYESYFDLQKRAVKVKQLINKYLSELPKNKRIFIISHSCILKMFTATGSQENGKFISEINYSNAIPIYVNPSILFTQVNPSAKL